MNICMVLGGYFPGDVRVTKEVRSLLEAGHKITLLSMGKDDMAESEQILGISVIRIFPPKVSIKRLIKTIWTSIFFDDLQWRATLEKIVANRQIEILHCHDLPMVNLTRKVARKFDIPVIADLHENFPEGIAAWRRGNISKKLMIYTRISSPLPIWSFKKLEKSALRKVDHIITVIDEAKNHYVNDCKIDPKKVTVVMNTEDLNHFDKQTHEEKPINYNKNEFIVTYIGNFGPHRGIETAIKSISVIKLNYPDIRLLLVGNGPKEYLTFLKRLCENLDVEDRITFTGWIDFAYIPSYIEMSDICLIPHVASGHTDTTIPHKLFQYMAKKKPVIVTNCKPLERIINECGCGIVVISENSDEMSQAIISLYLSEKQRIEMGENGRKAVENRYNWEIEGRKLMELYNRFEKE